MDTFPSFILHNDETLIGVEVKAITLYSPSIIRNKLKDFFSNSKNKEEIKSFKQFIFFFVIPHDFFDVGGLMQILLREYPLLEKREEVRSFKFILGSLDDNNKFEKLLQVGD